MCNKQTPFRCIAAMTLIAVAVYCRADEPSREYKVKAAFLYNFAQFVEWPASAFDSDDSPVVIAIVGDDPFNGSLDRAVTGKTIGSRNVIVRHFAFGSDLTRCHVLFVPALPDGKTAEVLSKVMDHPILTVGESDNFPWAGGCIRFFLEDNKERFEINLDSADRSRIQVSSKLIRLARLFKK